MIKIPANFSSKKENKAKCVCKESEDMNQIYNCEYLNNTKPEAHFRNIFSENLIEQKKVFVRFKQNMKIREQYTDMKKGEKVKNEATHVIHSDPLYSNVTAV